MTGVGERRETMKSLRRQLDQNLLKMVVGSANHYPTKKTDPAIRYLGGRIAHNELIRNLLSTGAVDGVDLFPSSGPGIDYWQKQEREAFQEFASADYRGATLTPRLSSWEQMFVAGPPSVFISSFPWTQRFAQLQFPDSRPRPGIANVIHSVPFPDLLSAYWALGATASEADVIVATSSAAEESVRQLVTWSASVGGKRSRVRIVRIPLGVSVDPVSAVPTVSAREEFGIGENQLVILYLGRLDPIYKADLAPLLVAVKILSRDLPSVCLVLAGSDDRGYSAQLRHWAEALGIVPFVRFVPTPNASQKASLLTGCDIFVSPSDNIQESFGLTVLEAMAYSKPVVASDWSGYRDLVREGETGFLLRTLIYRPCLDAADLFFPIDPTTQFTTGFLASQTVVDVQALTERLAILAASRDLRLTMGEAGRRRVVSDYSWSVVGRKYRELFDEQVRIRSRLRSERLSDLSAKAFGHYSTELIDADTLVQASMRSIASEFLVGGVVDVDIAFDVLDRARRPTRIAKLGQANNASVMRLLKLGLLRVVDKPTPNCAVARKATKNQRSANRGPHFRRAT